MTSDEYRLHTDLVKIANSIEKLTDELRKHRSRTRNEIREAFGIPPVEQKRPSEDDRAWGEMMVACLKAEQERKESHESND